MEGRAGRGFRVKNGGGGTTAGSRGRGRAMVVGCRNGGRGGQGPGHVVRL